MVHDGVELDSIIGHSRLSPQFAGRGVPDKGQVMANGKLDKDTVCTNNISNFMLCNCVCVTVNVTCTSKGVAYLHNTAGVVHGDLKPDNLLLGADGRVRIADFGSARAVPPGGDDLVTRTAGAFPLFCCPVWRVGGACLIVKADGRVCSAVAAPQAHSSGWRWPRYAHRAGACPTCDARGCAVSHTRRLLASALGACAP